MDPNAAIITAATVCIALFTVVLAFASIYQSYLTRQAINLGRNEFSAAQAEFKARHRPYLFVTDITTIRVEQVGSDDGEEDWGTVSYVVANYSDIPAIINSVRLFLGKSATGLPSGDVGIVNSSLLATKIFAPQKSEGVKDWAAHGLEYIDFNEEGPPVKLEGAEELFFHIIIKYRGPFSEGHETSACWKIGPRDYRFTETGGETLNHIY